MTVTDGERRKASQAANSLRCRSSFVVRRSSFVVRRSSFVVRRSSFVVVASVFPSPIDALFLTVIHSFSPLFSLSVVATVG